VNSSGTLEADSCPGSAPVINLSEEAASNLAKRFAALADSTRIRVLALLIAAPNGELCVCDLIDPLGKSQPTVSHHLKILDDAGLLTHERRGKWVWYRIAPGAYDFIEKILNAAGKTPNG
jgi:ArsR family transcriptional regulator